MRESSRKGAACPGGPARRDADACASLTRGAGRRPALFQFLAAATSASDVKASA